MFAAIQHHYAKAGTPVHFAVSPWFGTFEERARYGVLQKVEKQRWGRTRLGISLLSPGFRRAYGMVAEEEIDAVLDAFRAERFWGARRALANAVAESKAPAAVDVLVSMMSAEKDPRVLSTLAERCGEYRDPRIAAALTALIDRTEEYFALSFALASLGRQRGTEHLETLTAGAGRDDYRGLVRSGALRGLGETRSLPAFEFLLNRIGYGRERSDCAPAAINALAACAAHQEKRHADRAAELFSDQLSDPRERVRLAAAGALGRLKAKAHVGDLEAAIKRLPEQVHARVRRIIMGITGDADGKGETAALKETIEKLEDRCRRMGERLDKLEAAAELEGSEAVKQ